MTYWKTGSLWLIRAYLPFCKLLPASRIAITGTVWKIERSNTPENRPYFATYAVGSIKFTFEVRPLSNRKFWAFSLMLPFWYLFTIAVLAFSVVRSACFSVLRPNVPFSCDLSPLYLLGSEFTLWKINPSQIANFGHFLRCPEFWLLALGRVLLTCGKSIFFALFLNFCLCFLAYSLRICFSHG